MEHDGLFAPDSVTWRVHAHPVALIGGLRALLLQALHPLAMAGVAQHSDYREDPGRRLRRTGEYVTTVTFGSRAEAEAAGALVRRVHTHINGIDPVTGQRYTAEDPHTLLWVHCAEVHSFLAAYRAYGGRLSDEEQDRYLEENVAAAELVGIPAADVPRSRSELREYFAAMEPRLCVSVVTRETADFILTPPAAPALLPLRPAWSVVAGAAVGLLPASLRHLYGFDRPRAADFVNHLAVKAAATAVNAVVGFAPGDVWQWRARHIARSHPFAAEVPAVLERRESRGA